MQGVHSATRQMLVTCSSVERKAMSNDRGSHTTRRDHGEIKVLCSADIVQVQSVHEVCMHVASCAQLCTYTDNSPASRLGIAPSEIKALPPQSAYVVIQRHQQRKRLTDAATATTNADLQAAVTVPLRRTRVAVMSVSAALALKPWHAVSSNWTRDQQEQSFGL